NYINFWTGSAVQSGLNALIARGVPIGGTSAGMNVLSQFVYSALASQGVTSSQALADPFNRYITLGENFADIPILQGLVDDPHFVTRDRMGDRKSTRLNSSHVKISYAVFCLKKK